MLSSLTQLIELLHDPSHYRQTVTDQIAMDLEVYSNIENVSIIEVKHALMIFSS